MILHALEWVCLASVVGGVVVAPTDLDYELIAAARYERRSRWATGMMLVAVLLLFACLWVNGGVR
jgi:formate-dependent nitrite reductase membrane component NrfD